MILRHATPAENVREIERLGLLPELSQSATKVVWLHTPRHTLWAILHTSRRHACPSDAVHVLTVFVPREWVRRRESGLWYCDRVIPPAQIAGSPAWYAAAVLGTSERCHVAVEEACDLDARD